MELSAAKKKILDVSLELFSVYGYEATSVGQIADALGIKKPSLYSHFASKQEIFDTLVAEADHLYRDHSLFAGTDWSDSTQDHSSFVGMTAQDAAEKVRQQLTFLIHDPHISRVRRLLTLEQYRNPALAAMQEQHVYSDVLNYHVGLIRYLIDKGILIDGDAEIMALQYFSPISMLLYRVDRDPACEEEVMVLIERHILQFAQMYRKERKND